MPRVLALMLALFATAPVLAEQPASPAPFRTIDLAEFDRLRQQEGVVVLDVRTPGEFKAGRVPGAVNIPVRGTGSEKFEEQIAQLDKSKTYLVMCAAGVRSPIAAGRMAELGFKNLADFPGGMNQWREAGKPIEK